MKAPAKITFQDFPHSDAVYTHINNKISKLDGVYPNLVSVDVVLKQELCNSNHAKLYCPHITLVVPGDKISVSHVNHEDVYVALRDAFKAINRRLLEYARKQRGDVKNHQDLLHGRIDRLFLDEGFGFIAANDGDYYFDEFALHNADFDDLRLQMVVNFMPNMQGSSPQAKRVTINRQRAAKSG